MFKIELIRKLSCTNLIRYWSPEEYSCLDYSPGNPLLPLNVVFLNPRRRWVTPLTLSKFHCTRLSPVRDAGLSFVKKCFCTFLIHIGYQRNVITGSPLLPLNMALLNFRGCEKTLFDFVKICLYQVFSCECCLLY